MDQAPPQPGPKYWLPVVIGNIIPLVGVIFFGWSLANIIILYWIENLIIGFWNIPRILIAGESGRLKNIPIAIFFTIHYGIFCLVHGVFIISLVNFSKGKSFATSNPAISDYLSSGLVFGALTMFISIGWDFYSNYIKNADYKKWTASKAMSSPYAHIILIHLGIFIGALSIAFLGSSLLLLIFLIVGKSMIELKTRKKQLRSDFWKAQLLSKHDPLS